MKKILFVLLGILVTMGISAEEFLVGNAYIVNSDGSAYTYWEREAPALDVLVLHEETEEIEVYYSWDYEYFHEKLPIIEITEGSSYIDHFRFETEELGLVTFHFSNDSEIEADGLNAVMASYQIGSPEGMTTYIGLVAYEELQEDDEKIEAFHEIIEDIKSEYVEE